MSSRQWWRWAKHGAAAVVTIGLAAAAAAFFLRPPTVTVAVVTLQDVTPAVQGVGTVEAKVVVRAAAKISGRLAAVLVDQGDRVSAGQVVARLDRAEHEAQVEQAAASVQRARLAVAAQEVALRRAHASVQAAEAGMARLQATAALARVNAARWQQLYGERGVSRVEMDLRVTEAAAAGEDVRSAAAQRQAAEEETAFAQATLETLRQEIRVAEAALAAARARQADTEIRSPLDGVVVSRELEPGATVNPGSAILKLADPHTAWATVHVDEREIAALQLGDPADIVLRSAAGRPLAGRVARIQRESDRVTEQLAVDLAFVERPERLTLGEQIEATIRPAPRRAATAIPLASVVRRAEGPGAWVVVDGRMRFRPLRLGAVDPAGWVEVLAGAERGDLVVLAPGRLSEPRSEGRRVSAVRSGVENTALGAAGGRRARS
jgi:HlyD family secretion protein